MTTTDEAFLQSPTCRSWSWRALPGEGGEVADLCHVKLVAPREEDTSSYSNNRDLLWGHQIRISAHAALG